MLGPDLLVAPVVEPAVSSWRVYLPAGPWIQIWTGKMLGSETTGTWVTVDAPLGKPPVFFNARSETGWKFFDRLRAQFADE